MKPLLPAAASLAGIEVSAHLRDAWSALHAGDAALTARQLQSANASLIRMQRLLYRLEQSHANGQRRREVAAGAPVRRRG